MKTLYYTNLKLVLEDCVVEDAFLKVENGLISAFGKNDTQLSGVDLKGMIVMPGFIDGHIHGALGCDFMDGNNQSLQTILGYLPREGVTSVLATTMTENLEKLQNVVRVISAYQTAPHECKVAGIHLEGPFISKVKKGAQNECNIINPNIDDFEKIRSNSDKIKVVTYAVENDRDLEFTKHLISLGIKGSIGHSDAKVGECNKCFELGVKRVTHLHNAMSGFHHRNPGVVVSAFMSKMLCELIVDKIHIAKDVIKTTYQILGADNIALISDAISAKSKGDGEFELGGQKVFVENGVALLEDRTLAGSTLKYDQGMRNMLEIVDCTLSELTKLTSINQSKDLGLTTGQIIEGYEADFVVLNHNLVVEKTIINGQVIYERELNE